MRKILIALISFCLSVCLTASVSASDKSKNIDVIAKYFTETVTPVSYSVDISWTDMTFTYTKSSTRTWNPDKHAYKSTAAKGGWDKKQSSITVTNHSNVDIKVTVDFIPVDGTGITGVLKNRTGKLRAGPLGDYDAADSMTATLTIRGTPTEEVTAAGIKIGTVKVTVE